MMRAMVAQIVESDKSRRRPRRRDMKCALALMSSSFRE
jgi:hypothetical protein